MKHLFFAFLIVAHFGANAQRWGTGLNFNDENYAKAKIRANFNSNDFDDLPTSHTLKEYCPAPGNQLQLNTSPAWATAWSAYSILESQHRNKTSMPSGNKAHSPAYVYHQLRTSEDRNCEGGLDLYDALEFLKYNKNELFEDFMEFCPKYLPKEIQPKSDDGVTDYRKLFDRESKKGFKISAMKKTLSQDLPVVIGMHCPPSFFTARNFWQPTELMNLDLPGHALCVVGYDDEKYGGSFEVINSWGKSWGNDGFLWIRYDDFVDFTRYAYEVFRISSPNDQKKLSGSVQLRLNTDRPVPLEYVEEGVFKSADPFTTGTYFRVYLKNYEPAYIYIFGLDDENQYFKIFPHSEAISPALVYSSYELAIPGEDNYIEIIGDPGQENLCILYCKEPIDYNDLVENLAKYPGSLIENLDALLSEKVINPSVIELENDRLKFDFRIDDQTAVLIRIQINHI
jgi:hypothetical protein